MPFVIKQPGELNKEINNGKFYHHVEGGALPSYAKNLLGASKHIA